VCLTRRSYNVTPEDLFELFGKFGPIRYVDPTALPFPSPVPDTDRPCSQVRQGIASNTKGTAFVVYEDVMDAKQACDKLNGYNFQGRYLVGTYHATPRPTPRGRLYLYTKDPRLTPAQQSSTTSQRR
jgi:pre-mRNA branch site protein p14